MGVTKVSERVVGSRRPLTGAILVLFMTLMMSLESESADSLYPAMEAPFVEIVADGVSQATIVALTESARRPAGELNLHLKKMSGAELPVAATVAGDGSYHILIGDVSAVTQAGVTMPRGGLAPGGLAIVCDGDKLALVGETELAQFYAVDTFLEAHLDVRWFFPGAWGEHVPERKTIRVGRVSYAEGPSFEYRHVGTGLWALRNKQNALVGAQGQIKVWQSCHTYTSKLIRADRYFDTHPEYFSLIDGERRRPKDHGQLNIQLCTSNPELIEEVAKRVIEIVDADPEIRVVTADPVDGDGFCQCDACRALDEKGATRDNLYSRRLLIFTSQVAERVSRKYPEVMIRVLAYRSYMSAPLDPDIKAHPNVLIQFARGSGFACDNHALTDPSCGVNRCGGRAYLESWRRLTENICLYEYYWRVAWHGLPWPMVHAIRKDIPYFKSLGLWGVYTQWSGRNLATNGLNYYVAAKLLWDADLDVDALLADTYEKYYGEAAIPMQKYHEALESRFAESGEHVMVEPKNGGIILRLYSADLIDELGRYLAEAESVAFQEKVKHRVNMVRVSHAYVHMLCEGYLRPMSRELINPNHCWSGCRYPGMVDPELAERIVEEYTPRGERIRTFLRDNAALNAVENAYDNAMILDVKRKALLSVNQINAPRWPGRKDFRRGGEDRNKAGWLAVHPEESPAPMTETFTLWIYGNDFDSDDAESEHEAFLRNSRGEDVAIGGIAPRGASFDSIDKCTVFGPFPSREYVRDGKVTLTLTNPVGKWSGSTFYGVYVMPGGDAATTEEATGKAKSDLEWLRARALGFAEMVYDGYINEDGETRSYDIEIPSPRAESRE